MSGNTTNIESVTVSMPDSLAKAIRTLARTDKKRSASQLANALLVQSVKGRLNQKIDKAAEVYGEKWNAAASIMGADKMPMPKNEYVTRSVQELRELIAELELL